MASDKGILKLDSVSQLELQNVIAEKVLYRGRDAIRVIESADDMGSLAALAIIPNTALRDGIIETEIVGLPREGAPDFARGFVGIAFHVQPEGASYEAFYLRPTNSRADDQLRRNHSAQYISYPDYPWFRLREENPGVYESYVDLAVGEWTPIKIAVSGTRGLLYVNHTEQPCLVVNDLKLGHLGGQIGLWIGGGTEAYFSTRITLRDEAN
jgi:hypothetical protein